MTFGRSTNDAQQADPYAYVRNSPTVLTDPTGRQAEEAWFRSEVPGGESLVSGTEKAVANNIANVNSAADAVAEVVEGVVEGVVDVAAEAVGGVALPPNHPVGTGIPAVDGSVAIVQTVLTTAEFAESVAEYIQDQLDGEAPPGPEGHVEIGPLVEPPAPPPGPPPEPDWDILEPIE